MTVTVLKYSIMARTVHLNTNKTEQKTGCIGHFIKGILSLVFVFWVLLFVFVDGWYKVENLGRGYYVVGELGYYSLEYQKYYLGNLHRIPIPDLKAINTENNWILIKTENEDYWIVDKNPKPDFRVEMNSWSWEQIMEFYSSHQVIKGPLDSLRFKEFTNKEQINENLKTIIYYHIDVCPGYCLVQHNYSSWYLAMKGRRSSIFRSSKYSIIHSSPICEFGYNGREVFCKTLDDMYLIINTKEKSTHAVDSLSFYTSWEESGNYKMFSLPAEWSRVKTHCKQYRLLLSTIIVDANDLKRLEALLKCRFYIFSSRRFRYVPSKCDYSFS